MQRAVEEVAAAVAHQEAEPRMQHVMAHNLGHGEAVNYKQTNSFFSKKLISNLFNF